MCIRDRGCDTPPPSGREAVLGVGAERLTESLRAPQPAEVVRILWCGPSCSRGGRWVRRGCFGAQSFHRPGDIQGGMLQGPPGKPAEREVCLYRECSHTTRQEPTQRRMRTEGPVPTPRRCVNRRGPFRIPPRPTPVETTFRLPSSCSSLCWSPPTREDPSLPRRGPRWPTRGMGTPNTP